MKQILVVDDSTSMRRMVMASLRQVEEVKFCEASNRFSHNGHSR